MRMIFKHLISVSVMLLCFSAAAKVQIVLPRNNQTQIEKNIITTWNSDVYTKFYKVQIAANQSFSASSIELTATTVNNYINYTVSDFGKYYIRVKGNYDAEWSDAIEINILNLKGNADLISWFKADTSDITLSGSNVSKWTDYRNNSRIAVQGSAPQMPALISNIALLNNKSALSFNGNPSLPTSLDINPSITTLDYTMFCVRNYKNNNTNGVQTLLAGTGHGFASEVDLANAGFGASGIAGNVKFAPRSTLDEKYSLYTIGGLIFEKNIQNITPSVVDGSVIARNISLTKFGTRPDFQTFAYEGEIAEVLIYNVVVDSVTKNNTYKYLQTKYTPPVNLGTDTVFGSSFADTLVLNAGNRFVRYLWSNGDTTPATKVISSGTYSVTTTDVFGFQSTDEICVYPYKRLKGAIVNICPGDSITVNLGLDPSYSILWSNGKTTSSVVIKTPGQYTLTITKNGKTVKDTLNVTANLDVTPLGYTPGRDLNRQVTICGGEKIYINNDSLFESFLWSTGSNTNFGTSFVSGNVYINYTERNGCKLTDTLAVVVTGQAPTANFTTNFTCLNDVSTFTDLSVPPAGVSISKWKWNFSNGDTSGLQSPSKTFTTLGSYTAALKITTTQGCSDSILKTFVVNKKPIPSFYNLLSCAGIPTTFADQTVANSASVTDWVWDFNGLGVINGIQNPSFRFPSSGVYNVKLKATNSNGCSDTVTNQITVNASPISDFSFDAVCGKTPVTLKFLATVEPPNTIPNLNWGGWDFGDGSIETSIRNPQHSYSTPGTYNVTLQVNSTGGCSDTAIRQVKVYDFPSVDFTISQTQCTGKEIQFTDNSSTPDGTPVTKWNWFFAGEGTSEAQNPRYTFNTQGNYTIQLTAKNAVGCSGTKLRSIAVSAPPVPKFTFSPQNGLPPLNVNYTNQSAVNGNYLWSYGDNSPLVQAYNPPAHVYTTIGTYPIKLIATDFRGCTDTLTKYILVDKAYLDGVMASVSVIPNGDYYKIQVSVFNNSNIEITALGLSLQLGGGAIIRENWTGSLLPGQSTVYLFTGEIKLSESNQIPVICASIDNINNNAREDRTDNNTTCKELKVGDFDILNIYPNPAYENINFGVMLPKDGKINIRFIDVLGQQMYSKDFDGVKGYNNLNMSTMLLNAAVYVAEVSFDGQVVRKKFMRKDRK